MPQEETLDWDGLMRLGLAELRLAPREFWALTPRELLVMSGRSAATAPMTRAGLDALARAYPDAKGDGRDDG
jgi:uncharacterized phage protein (TIGR02216 family)